ncbi:MAG TPA: hypothetical protein PLB96_00940 [Syntrophales bacterium]|nr:hypothetical protein [Syntrophales bacterium]
MAKLDEVTSTERLLDLIRRKRGEVPSAVEQKTAIQDGEAPGAGGGPAVRRFFPSGRIYRLRKPVTLGVDIGARHLRMAKTIRLGERKHRLIGLKVLALPTDVPRDSEPFARFLKDSIEDFCGPQEKVEIWTIMSAARVDIRHIRIPKVPKKQIANAVYWTAKKDSPIDEKEMVFDFEVQEEIVDQGVAKYSVLVLTAPRQDVEDIRSLFARAGLTLAGVTIAPFASQNLFRMGWMPGTGSSWASLYIGRDHSRIDIFFRGNLVMNRGIKAGSNSMAETLMDVLNERRQSSAAPEAGGSERPVAPEDAQRILRILQGGKTLQEDDVGHGLAEEEVFEIVKPPLDRLIRQAERTFEYYINNVSRERIEKIYLTGAMNLSRLVSEYIGGQLGIEKDILDPLENNPAAALSGQWIPAPEERLDFSLALGVALSSNDHTPNLIFTYQDKERTSRMRLLNRGMMAALVVAVAICSGVFLYEVQAVEQRKREAARLDRQLSAIGPLLNEAKILQLAASVKEVQAGLRSYGNRYLGMAVISEIAAITPENVRLLSIRTNLGQDGAAPKAAGAPAPPAKEAKAMTGGIVIEGYLSGARRDLESLLAGYVMRLDASPLFRKVLVQKSGVTVFKTEETLHFVLATEIG